MRRKTIKKKLVALGLATAMALSVITVPYTGGGYVQAAEAYETGAETPVKVKFYAQNTDDWTWMDAGEPETLKYDEEVTLTFTPETEGDEPTFGAASEGNVKFGFQVQDTSLTEAGASSEIAFSVKDIKYNTASLQNQAITLENSDYTAILTAKQESWGLSGTDIYVDFGTDADLLKSITSISVTFKLTKCEAKTGSGEVSSTLIKEWNFDGATDAGWSDAGWDWQYSEDKDVVTSVENGMLKITDVDYLANEWSQFGIAYWEKFMELEGVNKLTFDFYYKAVEGAKFTIKTDFQYAVEKETTEDAEEDPYSYVSYLGNGAPNVSIDLTKAVDAEDLSGYKKVTVEVPFNALDDKEFAAVVLLPVWQGKTITYTDDLYIDNICLIAEEAVMPDYFVSATKVADTKTKPVSIAEKGLVTTKKDGTAADAVGLASSITLVDKDATANTKALYAYLKAMGETDSVIFGHQNDTWHKAGDTKFEGATNSDTKDVTGSISGIVGIDTLSLLGNEYSASRYNSELKGEDEEALPETAAGNVEAAVRLTNYNIGQGAIITLSAHMPNFATVSENKGYTEGTDPTYAKYDFSGYSPNTIKGDVMNEILPGGDYNDQYTAYLDMIAAYADGVDGTILFRPFHENTGSWFWWGKAYCDAAQYKNVWKYTVEYLRDKKGIHNLLYVYGPSSDASSLDDYAQRYPGDGYVDMIGFDMYNQSPTGTNEKWFNDLANELAIVNEFAELHGKLIAVTETGVANSTQPGDNQTALLKSENADKDWYNKVLNTVAGSNASYFLVWANFSEVDGFYTPYVKALDEESKLFGHEMLDNFIDFYNDGRSVFANDQKAVLAGLTSSVGNITVKPAIEGASGYITSPVSRSRILDAVTVTANITNAKADTKVEVVFTAGDATVKVDATEEGGVYSAQLTKDKLDTLGEKVGTITLLIDGEEADVINAIYNQPEPEEDPCEIDGFENYYGVDDLLTAKWATNSPGGDTVLNFTLTDDADKVYDGDYALSFHYIEPKGSYAGATINKNVDWSECNALQFYTIPDGNNQRVVIQITADGTEYEAWLQEFDGYRDSVSPMLVTVPFDKFKDRDSDGPEGGLSALKDSIQSCGLWLNAINDSAAFDDSEYVEGTIIYDKITAIQTDNEDATFELLDGGILTLINSIGEVELTPECKEKIEAARKAYDKLTDKQLKYVTDEALQKLTDAEKTYEDKKKAADVSEAINAIKDVKNDDASKKAIEAARKAYDALTADQKKLVSTDVLKKLTDAEAAYKKAVEATATEADKKAAADVTAKIEAIKDVQYDDASKAAIEAARKAYDALTADQKKLISADTLKKLTDAETAYAQKKAEAETPVLEATKNATNAITVKWTATEGAAGYNVYVATKKTYVKVGSTSSTSYKINKVNKKKLKAATAYQVKVVAYDKDNKEIAGSELELATATSPAKVKISSLSRKSSTKATLKWKKVTGASGYEVYMKTGSGKYKLVKTIKKGKTVSFTQSKLKKGKKYTFKVRAYKTAGGKKVYGAYSKTKSIK